MALETLVTLQVLGSADLFTRVSGVLFSIVYAHTSAIL
jgi:hypothetical protein